jgi:hypothetical protein
MYFLSVFDVGYSNSGLLRGARGGSTVIPMRREYECGRCFNSLSSVSNVVNAVNAVNV